MLPVRFRSLAHCALLAAPSVPIHHSHIDGPQRFAKQLRPRSSGETQSRAPQQPVGHQLIREVELKASFETPDLRWFLLPSASRKAALAVCQILGIDSATLRSAAVSVAVALAVRASLQRRTMAPLGVTWRPSNSVHQHADITIPAPNSASHPHGRHARSDSCQNGDPPSQMDTPPDHTGRPSSNFALIQAEIEVAAQEERSPDTNRSISTRTTPRTAPLHIVYRAQSSSFELPQYTTSASMRQSSARPHTRQGKHQVKPHKSADDSTRFLALSIGHRRKIYVLTFTEPGKNSRTTFLLSDWRQMWN